MKYIAAYALIVLGGKEKPEEEDVKCLLKDAGCKVDPDKIRKLFEAMSYEAMIGRKFNDVVDAGNEKVAEVCKKADDQPPSDGNTNDTDNENYYDNGDHIEEPEDCEMCGGCMVGDDDDY